ncbi:cytochrome d ubiquinol oxidase subunit II [Paenibacillus doosanensis]|uniref:Cytochrome bd menaquinol oxidase subunit II n=1 Tax=Paenibacillus konkukensis TaxID=2020716 RepID=A0ABY4RL03_9BACL|nr:MULTISPECIES: cytochrome d ubiquinol oxidase subunit II [Paenibacillus]MCS7462558.1 cytochrome d ubiquinol oxidase subunit II [Paenibacillus doosanensis]UQZ83106.1 Putative cytochrome bd menaquinol oxidase subunit II [Paenibacillus konkukensis]
MNIELIGITVLWLFLYGYLIVASIDFGAGFFSYYSMITGRKHLVHGIIERYLSPVWEVTNVFLIFFMVGMVGFFPDTAYYLGTGLLIPGSIAIVLLAIRGSYYAFSTYGAKDNPVYLLLYGSSGLFIPASLSIVLTISEGGYIEERGGQVVLQYGRLFTSPYAWSVVILSLVSILFISASFLTYYADKAKDYKAMEVLRGFAIGWSAPTILASLLVFFSIHAHSPWHFERMMELAWMFALSLLCFLVATYLIWQRKRLGVAFIMVMLQFAFAFFGYGAAHLPYILYPLVTIHASVTSPTMGVALIIAFIAGLLLLIPSLYLLMRLFLFSASYVQGKNGK